jgi:hypothetical protein
MIKLSAGGKKKNDNSRFMYFTGQSSFGNRRPITANRGLRSHFSTVGSSPQPVKPGYSPGLSSFQPKLRFKFPVFIERVAPFSLEINLGISQREQSCSGRIQLGSFCP